MKQNTRTIGFEDNMVISSKETIEQIKNIKTFICDLYFNDKKLEWTDLDNDNNKSLFRCIVNDRKNRVDAKTLMADRPPGAIATIDGNRVVRLEFYEGHDELELSYDLRSKELQGQKLENYLGT